MSFVSILPVLCAIPPAAVQIKSQITGVIPLDHISGLYLVLTTAIVGIPTIDTVHPTTPAASIKFI